MLNLKLMRPGRIQLHLRCVESFFNAPGLRPRRLQPHHHIFTPLPPPPLHNHQQHLSTLRTTIIHHNHQCYHQLTIYAIITLPPQRPRIHHYHLRRLHFTNTINSPPLLPHLHSPPPKSSQPPDFHHHHCNLYTLLLLPPVTP